MRVRILLVEKSKVAVSFQTGEGHVMQVGLCELGIAVILKPCYDF